MNLKWRATKQDIRTKGQWSLWAYESSYARFPKAKWVAGVDYHTHHDSKGVRRQHILVVTK